MGTLHQTKTKIQAMKAIEIKVSKSELEAAKPEGYVDGERLIKPQKLYVYVELGQEKEYTRKDKNDKNTEFRIFFGCTVYYAKSES